MSTHKLIRQFESTLKNKVLMRTGRTQQEEKVLLDIFKYYDLQETGKVDYRVFKKVVRLSLAMTISEEELILVYDHYQSANEVNYREFITRLFDSNVKLAQRAGVEAKAFLSQKIDNSYREEEVKKAIMFIINKLQEQRLDSFFELYWFLRQREQIGVDFLNRGLKSRAIFLSHEMLSNLHKYISPSNSLGVEELFEFLLVNFSQRRQNKTRGMF